MSQSTSRTERRHVVLATTVALPLAVLAFWIAAHPQMTPGPSLSRRLIPWPTGPAGDRTWAEPAVESPLSPFGEGGTPASQVALASLVERPDEAAIARAAVPHPAQAALPRRQRRPAPAPRAATFEAVISALAPAPHSRTLGPGLSNLTPQPGAATLEAELAAPALTGAGLEEVPAPPPPRSPRTAEHLAAAPSAEDDAAGELADLSDPLGRQARDLFEAPVLLAQAPGAEPSPEAPLVPIQLEPDEPAPAPGSQPTAAGLEALPPAQVAPAGAGAEAAAPGAGQEAVGPNISGFKSLADFLAFCREKKKVNYILDPKVPSEKINAFIRFDADETVDLDRFVDLVLQKNELSAVVLNQTNVLVTPARRKLWVVALKRARPEEVESALGGLDPEFSGKVKAIPGAAAVRITAFDWQHEPIMRAILELDGFAADRHTHTFVLNYAAPEIVTAQLGKFFGNVLTVDTDRGATITVSGPGQKLREAAGLIRALDRPRPHALIQLRLVEALTDRRSAMGLEAPDTIGLRFDAGTDRLGLLPKLTKRNATTFNDGVLLNVRRERGNVKVLAEPQVRMVEKEKATVQIGRKLPVRLRTAAKSAQGDNIQLSENIQFIDDGLKLEMELLKVNARKEITLKVTLDVIVVDERGRDGVPIQSNRATASVIRVANRDTVVIGGFVNEQEVQRLREIPVLGQLPIVGRFFTRENREADKRDLLLLMTPHVLGSKGGS